MSLRVIDGGTPSPTFDEVFRDNLDFVWRCARVLGGDHLAEDAAQEVFIVVRRRLDRFEGASIRAWLHGITRNVVRNLQRSASRRSRRLQAVPTPEPAPRPDDLLELEEAAALMDEFLDSLPASKREAFQLLMIEGLKAPEIAEAVGVPTQTVYSRVRSARKAFDAFVKRQRKGGA